jgi:hypothetical protein
MKKLYILALFILSSIAYGTAELVDGYYILNTEEELRWFADTTRTKEGAKLNAKLNADIDLHDSLWIPLSAGTGSPAFSGTFDGDGHTISNMKIVGDSLKKIDVKFQQNIGFVGPLSGTVKNLHLENVYIKSTATGGTIPNATGDKEKKAITIGTVVGWMSELANVSGVTSSGHIYAFGDGQAVGGIAGNSWNIIHNVESEVTIEVKNLAFVGGIVGMSKKHLDIDSALWKGNIIADSGSTAYIGGIIGNVYEGTAEVKNSEFESETVTESVGRVKDGTISADKLVYGVYTLYYKNNLKTILLDGDYTEAVRDGVFTSSMTVDSIKLAREFNPSKYSTITMPVSVPRSKISGATFYNLVEVVKNELDKWEVHVSEFHGDTIFAGVPYIIITNTDSLSFSRGEYKIAHVKPDTVSSNGWSLIGSFDYILGSDFGDDRANVYGFAAKDLGSFKAGQFVKAGLGAKIKPFRVYLHHDVSGSLNKVSGANTSYPVYDFTDVDELDVVIVDNNSPMSLKKRKNPGKISVEFVKQFDLLGRRVNR